MLLHFVPHMWPCHVGILPPWTPLTSGFALRLVSLVANTLGRCPKPHVRHVAGVQVAATLRFALPAPMPKRWVTPKASSAFAA